MAELAEGDCFGEIALLSNVQRTATVRCLTPCELTVLARDDFQTLTSGQGALAQAIRKQATERRLAQGDFDLGKAPIIAGTPSGKGLNGPQ